MDNRNDGQLSLERKSTQKKKKKKVQKERQPENPG